MLRFITELTFILMSQSDSKAFDSSAYYMQWYCKADTLYYKSMRPFIVYIYNLIIHKYIFTVPLCDTCCKSCSAEEFL